jgi:hypothetical protein
MAVITDPCVWALMILNGTNVIHVSERGRIHLRFPREFFVLSRMQFPQMQLVERVPCNSIQNLITISTAQVQTISTGTLDIASTLFQHSDPEVRILFELNNREIRDIPVRSNTHSCCFPYQECEDNPVWDHPKLKRFSIRGTKKQGQCRQQLYKDRRQGNTNNCFPVDEKRCAVLIFLRCCYSWCLLDFCIRTAQFSLSYIPTMFYTGRSCVNKFCKWLDTFLIEEVLYSS